MAVRIGSNIDALRAVRQMTDNEEKLSRVQKTLFTGQRINSASDGAAELSVASSLRADVRVYNQALRNVNDAVSLLNVVDGASTQLINITTRIAELSEQSANGTFSNQQRSALQSEVSALTLEYNRILEETKYNGISLFSAGQEINVQAGYSDAETLKVSLLDGFPITTYEPLGTFTSGTTQSINSLSIWQNALLLEDVNGDGFDDFTEFNSNLYVHLGNGDGSFKARLSFASGWVEAGSTSIVSGDFNGDQIEDIVMLGTNSRQQIYIGNGNGTFRRSLTFSGGSSGRGVSVKDLNNDSLLDLVDTDGEGITVQLGNGNGTFTSVKTYQNSTGVESYAVEVEDFNSDSIPDIALATFGGTNVNVLFGNGNGTYMAALSTTVPGGSGIYNLSTGDFNNDSTADIVVRATGNSNFSLYLSNGNGTFSYQSFGNAANLRISDVADLNEDGNLDVMAGGEPGTGGPAYVLFGNGNGTFLARKSYGAFGPNLMNVKAGDLNGDGQNDLLLATNNSTLLQPVLQNVTPHFGFESPLRLSSEIAVGDIDSARASVDLTKNHLQTLAQLRGKLGANMARLSNAYSNIQNMSENYLSAQSQIESTNYALETAELVKLSILQKSSVSLLSHIEQEPALALALLNGI